MLVGTIRVGRSARPPALGPDLLHGRFDTREYLRRARLIERPVAEMLLDQRVLAGIGNIVRCEALHTEATDPFAPVAALSDRTLLRLAAVSRGLLRAGVDDGGRLATSGLPAGWPAVSALRWCDRIATCGRATPPAVLVPRLPGAKER